MCHVSVALIFFAQSRMAESTSAAKPKRKRTVLSIESIGVLLACLFVQRNPSTVLHI